MVFTFLWIIDLKKKKGIYLPQTSTWVLILLVSPRGSLQWEKLTPTQGPTRPSRKNPTAHFSCPSFVLKEPVLGLPGQGSRWGH